MPEETATASFPVARAQMLIRRPASEVFAALVDPQRMSRFWSSRGSARIEEGSCAPAHASDTTFAVDRDSSSARLGLPRAARG